MGVLVRLPNIWWTCACDVADSLGNEWVEYVEVMASTKDEAYDMADDVCAKRGLGMLSAQIMARPEKKVDPSQARPAAVPALPAPPKVTPATPVTPWVAKEKQESFEVAFFTKYGNYPRVIHN